jgi:hypothetical protein
MHVPIVQLQDAGSQMLDVYVAMFCGTRWESMILKVARSLSSDRPQRLADSVAVRQIEGRLGDVLLQDALEADIQVECLKRTNALLQLAKVIAAGYLSTPPGFDEFLTKEISGSHNWSLLLAAFIDRAYTFSLPTWLLSFCLKRIVHVWRSF